MENVGWWMGGRVCGWVVPDEKEEVEGGEVLRWDGMPEFPNASKLAKLAFELP